MRKVLDKKIGFQILFKAAIRFVVVKCELVGVYLWNGKEVLKATKTVDIGKFQKKIYYRVCKIIFRLNRWCVRVWFFRNALMGERFETPTLTIKLTILVRVPANSLYEKRKMLNDVSEYKEHHGTKYKHCTEALLFLIWWSCMSFVLLQC